ncbi:hypothetical protein JAAARDRAFT_680703 [Jaapia argillacea MUCL 33604]|uniref:Protein kinase domain-containing protein n=1 Tax=Jaapia argillacea MUCL 33604 TaxID=933084 RepID=A0A067PY49_9AGAM|nr:hypothetical protein JAAARDRAFT_680703 [Jaapia argillacea MUCL 33604]
MNPQTQVIQDDFYPCGGGGFSNIYKGRIVRPLPAGRVEVLNRVIIKFPRPTPGPGISNEVEDLRRRIRREYDAWNRVTPHVNNLPLLQFWEVGGGYPPAIITPYCPSGCVKDFLVNNPTADQLAIVHFILFVQSCQH